MTDDVYREQLLARLAEIAAGLVDQARAIEALAVAAGKAGRAGTLRIKIDTPALSGRRKVRRA